jgi:hypothetical protein
VKVIQPDNLIEQTKESYQRALRQYV